MKSISLSIKKQVLIGNLFGGIAWLTTGTLGFIDILTFKYIRLLFLFISIIISVLLIISKKERSDEMSVSNINKADSVSGFIIRCIICITAIFIPFAAKYIPLPDLTWDQLISNAFFVLMGVADLTKGITFLHLEAE